MRVALIGLGAIGREVVRVVDDDVASRQNIEIVGALVRRPDPASTAPLCTSLAELLALQPDVVVECAGHGAVAAHVPEVLRRGVDAMVISSGAFADDALLEQCRSLASANGARVVIPAGAIAGLDGLAALRVGGLDEVVYTSTKPPDAWRGTPAEAVTDLAAIRAPTTVYEGDARNAALAYPKNANLAMTVALAGLGPDRTTVRLIADPAAVGITGRLQARGVAGSLDVTVAGPASTSNARTSAVTAHSIVAALINRVSAVAV